MEAAIIVPLLMLLTFGAIEFGIGFRQKGGLESVVPGRRPHCASTETDVDDAAHTKIGDRYRRRGRTRRSARRRCPR